MTNFNTTTLDLRSKLTNNIREIRSSETVRKTVAKLSEKKSSLVIKKNDTSTPAVQVNNLNR